MRGRLPGVPNSRDGRRRRRLLLMFTVNLVVAVASALILLLVLARPLGSPREPGILILGETGLQEEAARVGVPQGRLAPGFGTEGGSVGLVDLDGRPIELKELAGQPVWIVFWATYCHACQEEEPDLRRIYDTHRDDGLVVLAIDAGEPAADVRRYAEERQLPWTIALDQDLSAYDAYGAIGTPTHYFIDRDGRIAGRAFGRLGLAEMEAQVHAILGDAG